MDRDWWLGLVDTASDILLPYFGGGGRWRRFCLNYWLLTSQEGLWSTDARWIRNWKTLQVGGLNSKIITLCWVKTYTVLCSWVRASWINVSNCPMRCDYIRFYYISAESNTCFGWYPHPSSGAHSNCNYNIWHCSNRICYRLLSWRSRNDFSTTAEGSKHRSNNARCCNYSLRVLLMMGEGITRNM